MIRFPMILTILITYFSLTCTVVQAHEPTILRSDESGLILTWSPSDFHLGTVHVDDTTYTKLSMANLPYSAQAGHPQLPIYSRLVGLPPTGEATIEIMAIETVTTTLLHPILPASQPQPLDFQDWSQSFPTSAPTRIIPDESIYHADAFYPTEFAHLDSTESFRENRFSRLRINPIRVNHVSDEIEILRFIKLKITFVGMQKLKLLHNQDSDTFDDVLGQSLLNPESLQWKVDNKNRNEKSCFFMSEQALTLHAKPNFENTVKVIVDDMGLYMLDYTHLISAGLPLDTLDPRTFRLTHGADHSENDFALQEISIIVEGQEDGIFDNTDRIMFYAQPFESRYSNTDAYFLSYGQQNGIRMETKSGNPDDLSSGVAWHTNFVEENRLYIPIHDSRNGDRWYWQSLHLEARPIITATINLHATSTTDSNAYLSVWLQGFSNPSPQVDHRVDVSINDTYIGQVEGQAFEPFSHIFTVPTTYLNSGENHVTFSLPGIENVTIEQTLLDALSFRYPIAQVGHDEQFIIDGENEPKAYTIRLNSKATVYDVTNPDNPMTVTDYNLIPVESGFDLTIGDTDAVPARYLIIPNNQFKSPVRFESAKKITAPPQGADYIIISHSDFMTGIAPLATHHQNKGLRVMTVDVDAIYDTYGAGNLDPNLIKIFLQDAFDNWTKPAPAYVLLVGDGSYDFKNNTGWNPNMFIPPHLVQVDPWFGETATDNRLVTLSGGDGVSGKFPDMVIGRFPVNSNEELAVIVDKIINYETNSVMGSWYAHQLFVTDNIDTAGDFYQDSDNIFNEIDEPFIGERLYYNPEYTGTVQLSPFYTDSEKLRQNLISKINRGAGLISFHGHSSWHQWAEEGFLFWNNDPLLNDITQFQNGYRLPIFLEMTCFTGFFHHPEYDTFDETLLRHDKGGAIAIWSSTGLGISTGHNQLHAGFYQVLLNNQQQGKQTMFLAEAILAGKLQLYEFGFHQDLLDTFTLFGDPALSIDLDINSRFINYSHQVYLPIVMKN